MIWFVMMIMLKNNKVKSIIIFILLLLGMAFIPYIPLMILNIKIDSLSQSVKIWYNFFCDIVFIIIVFMVYKDDYIKNIKDYFKSFGDHFEEAFKYYIIGLVIMLVSNLIIGFCFKGANANNEEAVRNLINLYPLYMLFSVAIYAPFIEQIFLESRSRYFIHTRFYHIFLVKSKHINNNQTISHQAYQIHDNTA